MQQSRAAAASGEREGVCAFLQQSCAARIGHSRPSPRADAPASNVPASSTIINADAKRLNILGLRLLPPAPPGKPRASSESRVLRVILRRGRGTPRAFARRVGEVSPGRARAFLKLVQKYQHAYDDETDRRHALDPFERKVVAEHA